MPPIITLLKKSLDTIECSQFELSGIYEINLEWEVYTDFIL